MARAAPIDVLCMACEDVTCDFKPKHMQRRPLGPRDVLLDMKFCGVCHTDLHVSANHMAGAGLSTSYPCVPGHELAGVCTAVGSEVTKVQVGDHVGVGCMVDSCLECPACLRGEQQLCPKQIATYNGQDFSGRAATPGRKTTIGGYSTKMVVDERFAIIIPKSYPLEAAGPIMCAGATMYDPLKRFGATVGTKVAVVGLGGLGVLGIKLALAMGCEVTAISRSAGKRDLAEAAGTSRFLASGDPGAMKAAEGSFDLILNTIPVAYDWRPYQRLVHAGGRHIVLGISCVFGAAMVTKQIIGKTCPIGCSMIAGIPNTQAVIDLCAANNILPDLVVKPVSEINSIFEQLDKANDAGVRYVLDIGGTLNETAFAECRAPPPPLGPNLTNMSYFKIIRELIAMIIGIVLGVYPRAKVMA